MPISFCVTCRNRLWQLRQTLHENLKVIKRPHEICLADYGSSDGLKDYIWREFRPFIENSTLVFFEVQNEVPWSSPKSKNLSHRLASNDYLFNLDADNFVTQRDLEIIQAGASGKKVIQQWDGDLKSGAYGRIGMPAEVFYDVGGYDEGLLPLGAEDVDFLARLQASYGIQRVPPPERGPVQNTNSDRVQEVANKNSWDRMNGLNLQISVTKLELDGPKRPLAFSTYKGVLNGTPCVIDGLGNIWGLDDAASAPER